MTSAPVLAVCGIPGSGKTMLCHAIQRATKAAVIPYDHYEQITQTPPDELARWLAKGADFSEIQAPGLAEAIAKAAQRGPVVVDTPLGRALPECAPLIDHQIWLNCSSDLALSRKLKQMLDFDGSEERLSWVANYLAVYPTTVRPLFRLQRERVPGLSEVVLNANQASDVVIQEGVLVAETLFSSR